jgi:hypothetical protein
MHLVKRPMMMTQPKKLAFAKLKRVIFVISSQIMKILNERSAEPLPAILLHHNLGALPKTAKNSGCFAVSSFAECSAAEDFCGNAMALADNFMEKQRKTAKGAVPLSRRRGGLYTTAGIPSDDRRRRYCVDHMR